MTIRTMKIAEFDLLEAKVEGLLHIHQDLVAENRRLSRQVEELTAAVARLHDEREQTQLLKHALLERIDRLVKELGG